MLCLSGAEARDCSTCADYPVATGLALCAVTRLCMLDAALPRPRVWQAKNGQAEERKDRWQHESLTPRNTSTSRAGCGECLPAYVLELILRRIACNIKLNIHPPAQSPISSDGPAPNRPMRSQQATVALSLPHTTTPLFFLFHAIQGPNSRNHGGERHGTGPSTSGLRGR